MNVEFGRQTRVMSQQQGAASMSAWFNVIAGVAIALLVIGGCTSTFESNSAGGSAGAVQPVADPPISGGEPQMPVDSDLPCSEVDEVYFPAAGSLKMLRRWP